MEPIKVLSLFSGAGGDTLGLEQVGFRVVAFSEFDKYAVKSHLTNFPDCVHLANPATNPKGDIRLVPDATFAEMRGKVDMVTATFPCQPFSKGNKKPKGEKVFDDPRAHMHLQFLRATKLVKPRLVMGENVPYLLESPVWKIVKREFKAIGYRMSAKVFDCSRYGVPQKRIRTILVGTRLGEDTFDWGLVEMQSQPPAPVGPILMDTMRMSYRIPDDERHLLPSGWERIVVSTDLRPGPADALPPQGNKITGSLKRGTMYLHKCPAKGEVKLQDPQKPARTIITRYLFSPRNAVLVNNGEALYLRPFCLDELKRIMGFPTSFYLHGKEYKQIFLLGNAVPPPLIACVGRAIMHQFFGGKLPRPKDETGLRQNTLTKWIVR